MIEGPCGVLLNDEIETDGRINNFMEFPILHMFYVQGFFGSANAHGFKPKAIGRKNVLESQLDYLQYGNYGVNDLDFLVDAGVDADFAGQLIKQKRFFAYGNIPDVRDLVDAYFFDDGKIEIFKGIFIERIRPNVFRFTDGEEEAWVDLDEDGKERFDLPVQFEERELPSARFAVVDTGCGDGWDGYRTSFGAMLAASGKYFLVDAGNGIRSHVANLGVNRDNLEGIFISHVHDDHFIGLVDFVDDEKKFKVYSTLLVRESIRRKFNALTGQDFDSRFEWIEVRYDEWSDLGLFEVMGLHTAHPIENALFAFRCRDAKGTPKTFAYFGDLASFRILDRMKENQGGQAVDPAFIDKIIENYFLKADLKKVDVGGGAIHGYFKDFEKDAGGEVIFGHTSCPLGKEMLNLGRAAGFGETRVLIP